MKKFSRLAAVFCAIIVSACLSACGNNQNQAIATASKQLAKVNTENADTELDPAKIIDLVFTLKLRNRFELDQFIHDIHTQGHPKFHQTMSYAEIIEKFGPTSGNATAVASFLKAKGFNNVKISKDNMLIEASASVATITDALGTKLVQRIMPNGSRAFTNISPVDLPANLRVLVEDVIGLDTVSLPFTLDAPGSIVAHDIVDFPTIYNVGNTTNASNVTVGIIAAGDMTPVLADLAKFQVRYGLPAISTLIVGTQGAYTGGTGEWSLDSQAIVGMTGGLRQLKFYVGPEFTWQSISNAVYAAISDTNNPASVISMSIGSCESRVSGNDPLPRSTLDGYFQIAIAQGRTFVVSSGDTGTVNANCAGNTVLYPASSPYVVAVGGTSLFTSPTDSRSYAGEWAWYGSGGGTSTVEKIPTWQAIVPQLANTQFRAVPDIAFVGDFDSGAYVFVNGQPT